MWSETPWDKAEETFTPGPTDRAFSPVPQEFLTSSLCALMPSEVDVPPLFHSTLQLRITSHSHGLSLLLAV